MNSLGCVVAQMLLLLLLASDGQLVHGFSGLSAQNRAMSARPMAPGIFDLSCPPSQLSGGSRPTSTRLFDSTNKKEFSREIRLREEAESPFRRVRFFFYLSLGGGALTSLVLSLARMAAAASGINADLMQESTFNGVDALGLAVIAFLWNNDINAQESRMQRAATGAALAKLAVRVNARVVDPTATTTTTNNDPATLQLSDLRRDRGIEKRVVIAAAGPDKIQQVLQQARDIAVALEQSDLLVVPVVLPGATAPEATSLLPDCVALPVGRAWKDVVADETKRAKEQQVDVDKEGFCVILKKNGRVGQRTKGIFLDRMVGEVEQRRDQGMDVTNI